MNFRFCALISTLIGATSLVFPCQVEAGCGLDHCPIQSSTADEHSIEIPITFHTGEFNLTASQGNFIETNLGLIVAPSSELVIGAEAGWVVLTVNGEHKTGAGNPSAFAQYSFFTSDDFVLSLGSQLEFPMPTSPTAIASAHFELLPYASARYDHTHFYSTLRVGGRFALTTGNHDHERSHNAPTHFIPDAHGSVVDTTQIVNGHHDTELLLWWNMGRKWNDALDTDAFINGQTSLSDGTKGHTYATAGLSGITELFDTVEIHLAAEIPITRYRWFDWRSMVEATVHF